MNKTAVKKRQRAAVPPRTLCAFKHKQYQWIRCENPPHYEYNEEALTDEQREAYHKQDAP